MHDDLETLARGDESYGDGISVHAHFSNPAQGSRRPSVQVSLKAKPLGLVTSIIHQYRR